MSTTMDKFKKAMEQRKASEASLMEENQFQSAKQFMIPKRTVLWIFLMQFIGVVILGGFFYVNIEKDSEESFNKIKYKLDQLENKFDPINDQLAKVEEAMRTGNRLATRGVVPVNQPTVLSASPSTRIKPQPPAPQ